MEAIKAELERKKAALAALSNGGAKKYYKRGELEKLREEQYRADQERLEAERREKKAAKEAAAKAARNTTSLSAPTSGPSSPARKAAGNANANSDAGEGDKDKDDDETEVDYNVAESELVRRFRARDQPIRLFGETDKQRIRRLRLVEATEERSEGQRNDFRAAMAATDQDIVNENLRRKASIGEDGFEDEDEGHYRKKRNTKDTERELVDTTILSEELLQTDPDKVYLLLSVYFKRVLREWEKSLDARPEDVKRSVQGRLQAATQGQTAEYMKPFFKQLKKRALQPDVLARVSEIAKLMQEREYLQANDSYLRLSIGNAPWPIGVTMVGIHERSAREKIFSSQVAHALNDETQRKWIQSIKRLMTFAQTKWPPDDHAKMVG
ncbi:mRNA splicing protein prp18 [Geranomyces michiganensis]|nr:mRNA splicing protein prp18 [Geranomyces michiganensis]